MLPAADVFSELAGLGDSVIQNHCPLVKINLDELRFNTQLDTVCPMLDSIAPPVAVKSIQVLGGGRSALALDSRLIIAQPLHKMEPAQNGLAQDLPVVNPKLRRRVAHNKLQPGEQLLRGSVDATGIANV
jgi:hypothetical protein